MGLSAAACARGMPAAGPRLRLRRRRRVGPSGVTPVGTLGRMLRWVAAFLAAAALTAVEIGPLPVLLFPCGAVRHVA